MTSSSESGSCAKEVKTKVVSPNAKIKVETVDLTDQANAKATIGEQNGRTSNVSLVKQAGEWRISSVRRADAALLDAVKGGADLAVAAGTIIAAAWGLLRYLNRPKLFCGIPPTVKEARSKKLRSRASAGLR